MHKSLGIFLILFATISCSSGNSPPSVPASPPRPTRPNASSKITPPAVPVKKKATAAPPKAVAAFKSAELPELPGDSNVVVLLPEGDRVAACGTDGKVRLYQLPKTLLFTFDGIPGDPLLAISADGKLLAQASNQGELIRIWKVAEKEEFRTLTAPRSVISDMTFDAQTTSFAASCRAKEADLNGEIAIWKLTQDSEPLHWLTPCAVLGIAFSPDGKQLASAGGIASGGMPETGGELTVWDASNGRPIAQARNDHGAMYRVAYSKQGDCIAVSENDGPHRLRMAHQIRLVDPQTGTTKGTLVGHASSIQALTFTPDGRFLVSSGRDDVLRVWQVPTQSLRSMFALRRYRNGPLTMSHDGSRLAFVGGSRAGDFIGPVVMAFEQILRGEQSRMPDVSAVSRILQTNMTAMVSRLTFSADGKSLAISTLAGETWVYDTSRWRGRRLEVDCRSGLPAFYPDLKTAAVFGDTIKLWDTETSSVVHDFQYPITKSVTQQSTGKQSLSRLLWAAKVSPDAKYLATSELASPNQERFVTKLWDLPSKKLLGITNHVENPPRSIAFSRDGARMATASFSNFSHSAASCVGLVAVWDTQDLADPATWKRKSRQTNVERKTLSTADEAALAGLVKATQLRLTEFQQENSDRILMGMVQFTLSDEQKDELANVLQPLARHFDELTVDTDPQDLNWQSLTLRGTHNGVDAVRFRIPGDQPVDLLWTVLLADGVKNCGIVPAEGSMTHRPELFAWYHAHEGDRYRVHVGRVIESPDIAVGREYILWFFSNPKRTVETQVTLNVLPQGVFRRQGWGFPVEDEPFDKTPLIRRYRLFFHGQEVESLAISPNGALVAAAGSSELVKVWNVDSGEVVTTMSGGVIAFSPDSSLLAVSGKGEACTTVELWDLQKREKVRVFEQGHFLGISSLAFSPDGKRLVSGGRDGFVTLWNVESGAQEPILTRDQ